MTSECNTVVLLGEIASPRVLIGSDSFQHLLSPSPTTNLTMHFCPSCGNILLVEPDSDGMRFFCQTCPYLFQINEKVEKKVPLQRKQVDDVLGGDEAWENVDQTETRCPHCEYNKAYFMQIQIRSADEPSTTFYKCVQCKKQWND